MAGAPELAGKADILVCPPVTLLSAFAEIARGSPVAIGGQDCHAEPAGALPRDLSAEMEEKRAQVPANLGLILAAKNFERIGDHCTNIAEDIVYWTKGEIVRHAHT